MSDCIFCKIAKGEIPSNKVYEDDQVLCFKDLDPQAPVHVLMIPKKHLDSLSAAAEEDAALLSHMLLKIKDVAKELELDLKDLIYVSSAGLRVFLMGHKTMSKIGSMSLSNVCDDIKEVLTITGFADIFTIK